MPFDSAACCFDCGCLLTTCLLEVDAPADVVLPADTVLAVRATFFAGVLLLLAVVLVDFFLLDFFLLDLVVIVNTFLLAKIVHYLFVALPFSETCCTEEPKRAPRVF